MSADPNVPSGLPAPAVRRPGRRPGRWPGRWLGRSLLMILIVAVLAALLLVGVLTTTTGARWGIGIAKSILPVDLSIEKINGSFAGGLYVDNVLYSSAALRVQVEDLSVSLDMTDLLADRLTVSRISARNVRLQLQGDGTPPVAPRLPAAPFPVRVTHAELLDVSVTVLDSADGPPGDATPIRIASIEGAVTWDADGLRLGGASVRARSWSLTATSVAVLTPDQRLTGELQLDGTIPAWPAASVAVMLEGVLSAPAFRFTSQAPWHLEGRGRWDVAAQAGNLSGRYRLEPAALREGWPAMALAGDVDITRSPGGQQIRVDWSSAAAEPVFAGWQGAAVIAIDGVRADFTTGALVLPFVQGGTLNGHVDLDGTYPLVLEARWQATSFADNTGVPVRLGPGKVDLSGPLASPALSFTAESAVAGAGAATGTVRTSGRLTRSMLEVPDFRLAFGAGELQGAGTVGFPGASTGTHLAGHVQAKAFDPSTLFPQWPGSLSGEVALEATSPAGPGNPGSTVSADLRGTLRGQPVKLAGRVRVDGQVADLRIEDGRFGASRVHGEVARWPAPDIPWRADFTVSRFDVATWFTGWAGEADLRVRTSGTGKAAGTLVSGEVRGLTVGGMVPADLAVEVSGSEARHRIGLTWTSPQMTAQAGWQGSATLPEAKDWSYRFSLDQLDLNAGDAAFGLVAPADGRITPAHLRLAQTCVRPADANSGEVCVQAGEPPAKEAGTPLRTVIGINIRALNLDLLRQFLADLPRIDGTLTGSAGLNWHRDGRWSLRSANLATSAVRVLPVQPAPGEAWTTVPAVDVRVVPLAGQAIHAVVHTRGDALPAAHGQLQLVPGRAGWSDAALDGRIDFDLGPLAALGSLFPAYRLHGGRLSGHVAIRGTGSSPQPSGELLLTGGDIGVPELGLRLRDGHATVRMLAGTAGELQALDVALGGTSGGGAFTLGGRVVPVPDPGGRWDGVEGVLRLTGDAVQVIDIDAARVAVSPDLTLSIDRQALELAGELAITRARILVREQPASAVRVSADQRIVDTSGTVTAGSDLRRRLTGLDVRLRLGDDTRFAGYGLDAALAGSLRLRQKDGRTTANGSIRTREGGRYAAWGQTLEIRSGRLFWADTALTQPAIDVEASRTPAPEVTVGLTARGPLARPRIELWSTPALSQSEQLSWLLLGRSLQSSAATAGETSLVNQAAATLGIGAGNLLARQFGGRLPVDIGIEVPAGATQESAALVVGRQLTPDLYVSYGVSILERLSTLRIEYALSTLLRVVTESSGEHNAADVYIAVERP